MSLSLLGMASFLSFSLYLSLSPSLFVCHSLFVTLSLFSLFSHFLCVTNLACFSISPSSTFSCVCWLITLAKFNFLGLFDPMTSTPHRTRYWLEWRKTLTLFLSSTHSGRVVVGEGWRQKKKKRTLYSLVLLSLCSLHSLLWRERELATKWAGCNLWASGPMILFILVQPWRAYSTSFLLYNAKNTFLESMVTSKSNMGTITRSVVKSAPSLFFFFKSARTGVPIVVRNESPLIGLQLNKRSGASSFSLSLPLSLRVCVSS